MHQHLILYRSMITHFFNIDISPTYGISLVHGSLFTALNRRFVSVSEDWGRGSEVC